MPLTAAHIPIYLGGSLEQIKVQVIAGELPLLLGLQVLVDAEAKINIADKKIQLYGKETSFRINHEGHVSIQICPTQQYVAQSQRVTHLRSVTPSEGDVAETCCSVYTTASR